MRRVRVIDSHTGGEPTRVVISGGPDLGGGSMSDRLHRFRSDHDAFRSAVVNEPRGSDVIVGALLCEPQNPGCAAGVIYFNNVGYLGMCGHGTIGVAATLAYLGRIGPSEHRIETPVGEVVIRLNQNGSVTVDNVLSYRTMRDVNFGVPNLGSIRGDIAWGGNWFFLTDEHGEQLTLGNRLRLMDVALRIRNALEREGLTGKDGHPIDHIELFGTPLDSANHSRNFVLCPGGAYDRSPCGTGTSAKMACLAAEGKLAEGEIWRQEGVLGSVFEGSFRFAPGGVMPSITGYAYVNSEADLIFDPLDPFSMGLPACISVPA